MKYCVFLSYLSLGDTVESIPSIRAIRDMGYSIILVISECWLEIFKEIKWITFITYKPGEVKIFIKNDGSIGYVASISDRLKKCFDQYKDQCMASPLIISDNLKSKMKFDAYYDPRNRFNKTSAPSYASIGGVSDFLLGTLCSDFSLELGFTPEETPLLNDKFPIGLCVGSGNKDRRIKDHEVLDIIDLLQNDYQVYLFGISETLNKCKEYGVISLLNISHQSGIIETLSYLSKMKLFITPDSGLLHCAITMKIPTIMFPIKSRTNEPWMITNPWYVPYITVCKDPKDIKGVVKNKIEAYNITL